MQHTLVEYGYWAVTVGCFLEGETVLLLAGVAAQLGYLSFPQVVTAAAIGGFCSDETAFFVGRHFGPHLVGWSPRLATIQPMIQRKLQQHAIWVGFSVRFAIGLRTAVPVVVGASGLAPIRFSLPNAAGAIVWAIAIGSAGYCFGSVAAAVFDDNKGYRLLAVLAIPAIALSVYLVRRAIRPWKARRVSRSDRP